MLINKIFVTFHRRIYKYVYSNIKYIDYPKGIVSFTFDDFPSAAATTGAELLQQHGWKGTFYLAHGLINANLLCGKMCSLPEINHLIKEGHEIGNHTFSHINLQASNRSDIKNEIKKAKNGLIHTMEI